MKHLLRLTLITILVVAATAVHADPELDRLKARYTEDLRKLHDRYLAAGRKQDAERVAAELKAIGVEVGNPKGSTEALFVNTAWLTPTGTLFKFDVGGAGNRSFNGKDQTLFTWKVRPDHLVEVTGPGSQGKPDVTWFFRFDGKREGYYGPRIDDVSRKLDKQ